MCCDRFQIICFTANWWCSRTRFDIYHLDMHIWMGIFKRKTSLGWYAHDSCCDLWCSAGIHERTVTLVCGLRRTGGVRRFLNPNVVLIARPPFIFGGSDYNQNTLAGVFYSILSSVAAGGLYICLRKMGSEVHYTITALYYSITGLISIGIILSFTSGFTFICQVKYEKSCISDWK